MLDGVEYVFAYPGGASLELHPSLTQTSETDAVLSRLDKEGCFFLGRGPGSTVPTGNSGLSYQLTQTEFSKRSEGNPGERSVHR